MTLQDKHTPQCLILLRARVNLSTMKLMWATHQMLRNIPVILIILFYVFDHNSCLHYNGTCYGVLLHVIKWGVLFNTHVHVQPLDFAWVWAMGTHLEVENNFESSLNENFREVVQRHYAKMLILFVFS